MAGFVCRANSEPPAGFQAVLLGAKAGIKVTYEISIVSGSDSNTAVDSRDAERIEALLSLDILDTPEEEEFNELVRLASEICSTPISLVSLVDRERQWFKASVGLDAKETPRSLSFCSHAIRQAEIFIIEDAEKDERFQDNLLVTGKPGIRFYAGIPLHAPNGSAVGTLCVIDTVPRTLSESQKSALTILGRQVKARMELRVKQKALEKAMLANEELTETLKDRNHLFSAFMNNGPFVSYIKDREGRMVFYNNLMAERFGVTADEWIGKTDGEIWPTTAAKNFRDNDLRVLESGVPVEMLESSPGPDDTRIYWKSYKFPLQRENGHVMLAGMSLDVTEELRRTAALERTLQEKVELSRSLESSTALFKSFVNNNPNICYFKAEDGKYLSYNKKFAELFGIDNNIWIGKSDFDVLSQEVAEQFHEHDLEVLKTGAVIEQSRQVADASGKLIWLKSVKFPIRLADERTILGGVAVDFTREMEKESALAEANAQLERLATTDDLTGLWNRRVFEERAAIEIELFRRTQRPLAMIVMDIDDFKRRNDTLGHAAGDQALRALGAVVRKAVRLGDTAARIGGEEFAILLPDTDESGAAELGRRMQALLLRADSGGPELTVSIGVARLSDATRTWERLLSRADDAMYQAKRAGKNQIAVSESSDVPLEL